MISLDQIQTSSTYEIETIDAHCQSALVRIGLFEGVSLELIYRMPFGGPLCLRINGKDTVSIRKEQAKQILCKQI